MWSAATRHRLLRPAATSRRTPKHPGYSLHGCVTSVTTDLVNSNFNDGCKGGFALLRENVAIDGDITVYHRFKAKEGFGTVTGRLAHAQPEAGVCRQ